VTKENKKKKLGEILVEAGLITSDDFEKALFEQKKKSKKKLGEILVDKCLCTEHDIAAALSSQLGIRCVDLKVMPIEPEAVEIIPLRWAKKHSLVPISIEGEVLNVAMVDPFDEEALQDARFASGYRIRPHISTHNDIQWAVKKHYDLNTSLNSILDDMSATNRVEVLSNATEDQNDIRNIKKQSEAAPIIRIVNHIISMAVEQKASDIHLEPEREVLVVRGRVDGVLRLNMELPKWVQGAVVSRIKIMGSLDIAEKRIPQDGRIGVRVDGEMLDLRVSTLPTNYGEKIVIRILDPKSSLVSIEQLGMDGKDLEKFRSLISKPQGIILVTGPTGSGKTTTLYTGLSEIRSVEKNVTTIEDPIEYNLEGINQVSILEKAGRTFPSVLRSVLRQDPDVIMVGEMRDVDTATIAMQAALTGHLVFSTIHTNNTVATITRLRNLGIPSYLIASTIIGIIAQRLVRVICPSCKTNDSPKEEMLMKIGLSQREAEGMTLYRGKGCPECGGTGFKGRVGIYELLVFSQRLREQISNEATESTMRQLAAAEGMTTLTFAGVQKVLKGTTSVAGVLHVNQSEDGFGTLCSQCGAVLGSDFVACPQCGVKLIDICSSCNKIMDPSWSFCPYCAHQSSGSTAVREQPKAIVNE